MDRRHVVTESMVGRTVRLLRYFGEFGLARGGALLAKPYAVRLVGGEIFSLTIGTGRRVWLRATSSDIRVFDQIFVHREYAIDAMPHTAALRSRLAAAIASGRPPVILDCGANIGLSALWFAWTFPQASIYAIEPHPANFDLLQRNVAKVPNIVPVQGAVWGRSRRVMIVDPEAEAWAFQIRETSGSTDTEGIPAFTIDDLLARAGSDAPLIAKIDVEGAEAEIFSNGTTWLDKAQLVIIELHDWMMPWVGTSRSFLRAISQYPFDCVIRGESLFCFHHALRPKAAESAS